MISTSVPERSARAPASATTTFGELIDYEFSRLPSETFADHLGVQLDIMARLLHLQATADEAGQVTGALRDVVGGRLDME